MTAPVLSRWTVNWFDCARATLGATAKQRAAAEKASEV
jgi:hypothetical protein